MTQATKKPNLPRKGFHRAVFISAGIYNICWGIFTVLDPGWLFRFAEMPPEIHPQIFSCLGMVIGLYGILYLEVARMPEHGWLLAAVGLIGKILGPIGLFILIAQGTWPASTLIMCITNDFIWWIPFAIYLKDSWPFYRNTLPIKFRSPAR